MSITSKPKPDPGIPGQRASITLALSVTAAASASGVSRATLYRLIQSGAIVPRKCGHRTLILVSELERFLETLPVGVEKL